MINRLIEDAKAVIASWESGDLAGAVRDLENTISSWEESQVTPNKEGIIKEARQSYAAGSDENIEIDDYPDISPADKLPGIARGCWVSAWVWVAEDEEG